LLLLFFFQAEDGIRDLIVTGVQTCALPISAGARSRGSEPAGRPCSSSPPARGSTPSARSSRAWPCLRASPSRRPPPGGSARRRQIGRASCRERGEGPGGAVSGMEKSTVEDV